MILDAFSLQGKVAVVSGCDTGLGQGMALGLAEAGCDIVGINIVEPTETIERVTALGRRFLSLTADLRKIDAIPELLDRAVAEFGHIDILVNNAGLIRREDAINFSETDWDDVMNLNIKSVFFMSRAAAKHFIAQERRQDHQYCLHALFPWRHPRAVLHRIEERRDGRDPSAGERVGAAQHQRQRDCAGLHGHQQYPAAACG